jgi:hypothetical protein
MEGVIELNPEREEEWLKQGYSTTQIKSRFKQQLDEIRERERKRRWLPDGMNPDYDASHE